MMKLNPFFTVLILLIACADPNSYEINGKVTDSDFEGKTIELIATQNNVSVCLHQSQIKDGKFVFNGKTDSSFVATVKIITGSTVPYFLPVAVEPGKIYVEMGKETLVAGTPMNIRLQEFMLSKEEFTEEHANDSLLIDKFHDFIELQVEKNKDFPQLADYISKHYGRDSRK